MRIVASIQARMGSSRLPGKVLKDICGKPLLLWHVERVKRSRLLDDVIVATTTSEKDDEIEAFCEQHAILCYRGSEDDVLNRISSLIRGHQIDVHVEFCGDSPLTDPQIIDEFVGYYLKYQHSYDYVSSAIKTTYPPGQEVIVYRGGVLSELDQSLSTDDPMREHVGYNITRFPDRYRLASLEAPDWFYEPEAYLEVDTLTDLEMMRKLISHFAEQGVEHFTLSQILELLRKQPEIMQLNSTEERRWKSLREDSDA
jgi:spore coat polysaccharide biosynthesis protein SpsF